MTHDPSPFPQSPISTIPDMVRWVDQARLCLRRIAHHRLGYSTDGQKLFFVEEEAGGGEASYIGLAVFEAENDWGAPEHAEGIRQFSDADRYANSREELQDLRDYRDDTGMTAAESAEAAGQCGSQRVSMGIDWGAPEHAEGVKQLGDADRYARRVLYKPLTSTPMLFSDYNPRPCAIVLTGAVS